MLTDSLAMDPLTGALSRSALRGRLDGEIERAGRLGVPLVLCIIDLDYFKSINDAFGHRRGDLVLEGFAARAQTCLRSADALFRYGGDEFVLLLPDTDRAGARILLDRLVTAVTADPFPGDPPIGLTLSIGAALLSLNAANAEELFEEADRHLYEAKRQGRAGMVIEPASQVRRPDLNAPSRLLERDQALAALHQFLDVLPHRGRAVLAISGPPGAGHTRFFNEAVHAAGRQNFATLTLRARPALRTRLFGALAEAEGSMFDLEAAQGGAATVRETLRRVVTAAGKRGVVIAVESLLDLDGACFDLFTNLLAIPESGGPLIGLICTTGSHAPERVRALDPAMTTTVELTPFTYRGAVLWLRGALAWEIPEPFARRLHEQSGGLPALLARITRYLIEDRRILPDVTGWSIQSPHAEVPLPANLRTRKTPQLAVPSFLTAFVGRVAEIQSIKQLLEIGSLVSIVGPGGVGKTRLAIQAASEVGEQFADGVCFVPLASLTVAADLAQTVGSRLGAAPVGRESAEAALAAFLRGKELLLILDNIEHLRHDLGLVTMLREQAPAVTLLITSREPLYLPHEVTVSLSGLQFARREEGEPAAAGAAMQLFVRRVQGVQPSYVLGEDDLEAAARICRVVEGLPLAIELAAAWVRSLGCAAVAAAIEQNMDFLSEETETGGSSRSARAVLDYFWSTLSPSERTVLQSLAVFRGGFSREIAQPVAGASPFFLDALVQKAFLTVQTPGRFQMHELLRQYADRQSAVQPIEDRAAHARHAACYLELAEEAEAALRGPDQRARLDRLELEHGNLRAALDWSLGSEPDAKTARRLASALAPFWLVRGHFDEGRRWLGAVLAAGPGGGPIPASAEERARALNAAATLAIGQSDFATAGGYLQEAASLWPGIDERAGLTETSRLLGLSALNQGQLETARIYLETALASRSIAHERPASPGALLHLGKVMNLQGNHPQAKVLYEEYLALVRQSGDLNGMADVHNSLASVACDLGDYSEAIPHFEEALSLARHLGNKHGTAKILLNLGTAMRNQGEYVGSAEPMAEALALFQMVGDARGIAVSLMQLGKLAYLQGDPTQAVVHYSQALPIALRISNQEAIVFILSRLAVVAAAMGRFSRAASLYGAESALRAGLGLPLPPADQAEQDEALAVARAGLDEPGWETAWATGSSWNLEQAIAFALDER